VFRKAQPHRRRSWIIPAVIAAILLIGGVTSNLIANYIQPILDPYRRWVWLAFVIAAIVTVLVAIRDHRKSDEPVEQRIGQTTAQGWINNVIKPLLPPLRAVENLLAHTKVWTWWHHTVTFERIRAAKDLIYPSAADSLEHFAQYHPDIQAKISLYDQRVGELATACQRLHNALRRSEPLRRLYERAKMDDSVVLGQPVSGDFSTFTETDHLDSLAESIVNRRHKESFEYTFRRAWSQYYDELLALRDLPDFRPASEHVDRAGEELLQTVRELIDLLVRAGRNLADNHEASF
jgi:hypothetical protein